MKVKIVTSLSKELWDAYAKNTLATWVDNLVLDEGSEIEVWIKGEFPVGMPMRTRHGVPFKYKSVETQNEGWCYFYETFSNHPRPKGLPDNQKYKYNFLPFSIKVYALAEAAWATKEAGGSFDYVAWVDADVRLKQPINTEFLNKVIGNADFAWLDRGPPWGHGETGFMIAKATDQMLDVFLAQANVYGSGQLFYFAEWHDAFIMTTLIRMFAFTNPEVQIINLNKDMEGKQEQGLYPFKTSILNDFMDHYKGQLKTKVVDPKQANTFAEAVF